MAKITQSIEPNIAFLANGWLKSYGLDFKQEQESLNSEIDRALEEYSSKTGGGGGNRPDAKLILESSHGEKFPILIEYKGKKGALVKLGADGNVENRTAGNEPNFKNIRDYAVNGAVHYANALLHHTSYTDIIAIGMTGEKDQKGEIRYDIGVYYVSKKNLGVGQKVGEFTDFSFLAKENADDFIERVKNLSLSPEELDRLKEKREKEIEASLTKLNNDIYKNEHGLSENDRVYLVAASIISTLGVPGKVKPLEKEDLTSSEESGGRDGDIMIRKINAFFEEKHLPQSKKDFVVRTLANTLLTENINKTQNGESQLKRIFSKIVDDLGIYYKIGLTTDFTGKLFNEMYSWLGFTQDGLNDVVLTPSYVSTLLVRLARVNKDSYVWDFATGSAGLLVAAMNEMLKDAKDNIHSPEELQIKEAHIKSRQLLGVELLPSVYMLAILNMIMMGDGSSNIINKDSLTDFDGNYGFGSEGEKFPADAFVLNPPYSVEGRGMVFVETALNMMRTGYAAIIIQNSAGDGAGGAKDINRRILQRHTLMASIKMPIDLFAGKAGVQTRVYVFRVNEKHHKDEVVKFIDFSNDGYTRTSRKKASSNLRDTDRARERYQEVVDLVRFGKSKLNIFTEKEYYENTIDPENGTDWNQSAPIDTKPTLDDFKETVSDYLAWEVSSLLKSQYKIDSRMAEELQGVEWVEYRIGDLFEKIETNNVVKNEAGDLPATTAVLSNNQIGRYVSRENATILKNVFSATANGFGRAFYQPREFTVFQDSYAFKFKDSGIDISKIHSFIVGALNKVYVKYDWANKSGWSKIREEKVSLPTQNGEIDFDFMERFIAQLEAFRLSQLEAYLSTAELKGNTPPSPKGKC